MELLTVKNNIINYSNLKKVRNETSVSATIQQTGDTQTTDKQAAKKEDGNKIDLKYLENNRKNKKIRKNFLKNFTINIGNFF